MINWLFIMFIILFLESICLFCHLLIIIVIIFIIKVFVIYIFKIYYNNKLFFPKINNIQHIFLYFYFSLKVF
jgi:hypothetical protein